MLKKSTILLVLAFLILAGTGFSQQTAQTGMEWKIVKDLDLKAAALDVSSSEDGRWLFIFRKKVVAFQGVFPDRLLSSW